MIEIIATGDTTLHTAGKYCEEDILVKVPGGGGDNFPIGDGNTHIWISVPDGVTKLKIPMKSVVNQSVYTTVDWGDGTEPKALSVGSGATTSFDHEYQKSGDYVISIYVEDGVVAFNFEGAIGGQNGIANENRAYRRFIKKVELGKGIGFGTNGVFKECYGLTDVYISEQVSLDKQYAFSTCTSLKRISLPEGITKIPNYFCEKCTSLSEIVIPESVTTFGDYVFDGAYALVKADLPSGVTTIGSRLFLNTAVANITIPSGITAINSYTFGSVAVKELIIPSGVTTIGNYAFNVCYCCSVYDFSKLTAVPSLGGTRAFPSSGGVPYEIRVPAALVDEWKAATNWSTYASKIVGV